MLSHNINNGLSIWGESGLQKGGYNTSPLSRYNGVNFNGSAYNCH